MYTIEDFEEEILKPTCTKNGKLILDDLMDLIYYWMDTPDSRNTYENLIQFLDVTGPQLMKDQQLDELKNIFRNVEEMVYFEILSE